MRFTTLLAIVVMFCPLCSLGQLPSSRCNTAARPGECGFLTGIIPTQGAIPDETTLAPMHPPIDDALSTFRFQTETPIKIDNGPNASAIGPATEAPAKQGFHWAQALRESFTFLAIEQAYVLHDDFRWVVVENGIPFNHYWRDYMQSLTSWWKAGWNAGENPMYNYVGHPIQGAMTGYIEIQNDPQSENLEFANSKEYWRSRLIATIWNTVYSTQWSMGPLSEMTVEKYGTKARPPWNHNGSWPCTEKYCYSGVGKVNIVITPVGGLGWMVGEDWLDKKLVRRVERDTSNRFLINAVRCGLNPIRGGASILHGRAPWFRMRDQRATNLLAQGETVNSQRAPLADLGVKTSAHVPDRGNLFAGYSYTNSDVVTGSRIHLSGWDLAVEKKYLHFFGLVGDISGQYGSSMVPTNGTCQKGKGSASSCTTPNTTVNQYNYLAGIRGGHSVWRIRPYAQAMVGAVRTNENTAGVSSSHTRFTVDLAAGLDFRVAGRVRWRMQADYLTAGTFAVPQHYARLSVGPAICF